MSISFHLLWLAVLVSVDTGYLEGKGEQGTRGRATGDNTDPSEQEDIDQCAAT